jgi:ribonuclease HII
MAILAGIDEAGFGPLLGPMVVSSSSFSVPDELVFADLWDKLRKSVTNTARDKRARLLIADSKKAYSRKRGLKDLQRTVHTCIESLEKRQSQKLSELFSILCPDCLDRLGEYPWYKYKLDKDLPNCCTDIPIAANMFTNDLQANGIMLRDVQSSCLDVEYYNDLVTRVKNKSRVLFTVTSQLLYDILKDSGGEKVEVVIDRQGGRTRYGRHLLRMFPGAELKIIKETKTCSSYELTGDNFQSRVHFVVNADNHSLPVSLASMTSKYIRELLVAHINDYFTSQCPGLKPTAGYYQDGKRFLSELEEFADTVTYDKNKLVRVL